MAAPFTERLSRIPELGVGLSTEFGAGAHGVDPIALREETGGGEPFPAFLELGADVSRGFDADAESWIARGWPTTYHFLDLNLEEPEDLDESWLQRTVAAARRGRAAWLCGDAGLWHVGPRDRGHGTLLPPILCAESVRTMAEAVCALRERSGFEVLPENPPAQILIGDLHPLEYFGELAERADCGLLLDVSHLAIAQRALGLSPTSLLDAFPVERVLEVHVAGGRLFPAQGRTLIDDDHGPEVVADTWEILDAVLARATSLRAVLVECERNPADTVRSLVAQVRAAVRTARERPLEGERAIELRARPIAAPSRAPIDHRRAQRILFRMALDPVFAAEIRSGERRTGLSEPADGWLRGIDPVLLAADPGDRRRDQLLGNVAIEFLHTVRAAPSVLSGFLGSDEFHAAIEGDHPLALAFAAYAARVLPSGPARALLALDAAMAEARRVDRPAAAALVALAPGARLIALPEGTLAAAGALRDGQAALPPSDDPERTERVLVVARGEPGPERPVSVELLSEGIVDLLITCPLDAAGLAAFASEHEIELSELFALVEELGADGAVVIAREREGSISM